MKVEGLFVMNHMIEREEDDKLEYDAPTKVVLINTNLLDFEDNVIRRVMMMLVLVGVVEELLILFVKHLLS